MESSTGNDERLQNLFAREDWKLPDPMRERPPMHAGAVKRELPSELEVEELQNLKVSASGWFGEDSAVAFTAVRRALEEYNFERIKDWDRRAEIRDRRGLKAQRRKLAALAKHLKAAGKLLDELGDDGRRRLVEAIHPFGARPGAPEELEDLAAEVSTAARAAVLRCEHDANLLRRGRRPELVRRWLVYRLKLVWETFALDPSCHKRRGPDADLDGPWPLRDFVEAVLALLEGGGERFLRDLVYPASRSGEEKVQISPDSAE